MKQTKRRAPRLQLRLSVKDVKPEIWRKLLVSPDITLERLHSVLQVLMGWRSGHLYAFVINKKRYSPPNEVDDLGKTNSIHTKLSTAFAKSAESFTYEYDFGDGWEVEVHRESIPDDFHENQLPECLEGCRHGPAEDTGGSRGYMEKAKIYNNPQHRRYQEIRKLIGPDFDPERFDLVRANEVLREIV
jgi:Plasmid pRiA4b ORF-3-like protein